MSAVTPCIVRNSFQSMSPNHASENTIRLQVREALKVQFPTHEVVEIVSHGSVPEQLEVFATASIIVAPHTAALSSMIVSPLHTPVLEIGPPGCSSGYMQLAIKVRCARNVVSIWSAAIPYGAAIARITERMNSPPHSAVEESQKIAETNISAHMSELIVRATTAFRSTTCSQSSESKPFQHEGMLFKHLRETLICLVPTR